MWRGRSFGTLSSVLGVGLLSSGLSVAGPVILNQSLDPMYSRIEQWVKAKYDGPETRLCLALPENTRYFLYRRFISKAIKERAVVQDAIAEKYSIMAYLVCRESSGQAVAMAAHRYEKTASRYGTSYNDFKKGISDLVSMRNKYGKAAYFDYQTNAGPFQISADQVDDVPDKYDPNLTVHRYFSTTVRFLNSLPEGKLLTQCGTLEYFDPREREDQGVVKGLKDSLKWMVAYMKQKEASGKPWFRDSNLYDVIAFHQIQTLCPHLGLEIAKQVHHFKEGRYFGPLNNTQNSGSCGKSYSLCKPILSALIGYLNQADVAIR